MAKDIHTNSSLSVHSDWSGVSREPFQMYMSWLLKGRVLSFVFITENAFYLGLIINNMRFIIQEENSPCVSKVKK